MGRKKYSKKVVNGAAAKRRVGNKRKKFKGTPGRANLTGSTYHATIMPFQGSAKTPIPRVLPRQVYRVRQAVNAFNSSAGISGGGGFPFFVSVNTGNTFPTIQFTFNDLSQEGTFAGLFDQYRIDLVEMILTPSNSVVDLHSAASPNQVNPQVYVVADFDDATALASIAAAQQYDNCKEFNGTQGCHIIIRPAISPAIWAGGAFSGYAVEGPQWLDCNSDTIPHYGLKFVVQGLNATSTEFYQWNIQCFYHLSFQNVR
jgi:hypothetical protein